MYDKIGKQLKSLATVFCVFGILSGLSLGFWIFESINEIIGIAFMIAGPISSWIGYYFVYAFGELVENSSIIAAHYKNAEKEPETEKTSEQQ